MEPDNSFLEEFNKRLESLSENDVAVFDHIGNIPSNERIHTQAYFLLVCNGGRASCRIGDKIHEIHRGDIFLCHPSQFVENAMASLDFKCQGVVMSANYLESILLLGGKMWDARRVVKENPVIHLNETELELAIRNNEFLRSKVTAPRLPHHQEMINLLLKSLVFEFYDILAPKLQLASYSYTSAENIFNRFMTLAETATPQHRDVKYYADQICVTSKYLSSICKKQSGNTASTLLNQLTIEHIKRELRSTTKSIKEIATDAGFDNLSFFGKYVRRELGISPREFRLAAELKSKR